MAGTTGTLTAAGSVTLTKQPTDTLAQFQISGTYAGVSFVLEGSLDGTNWSAVSALLNGTNAASTGTISPADNAVACYDVVCAGYGSLRLRVTAISSGTLAVAAQAAAYVGIPVRSVSSGATQQSQVISGDGAITITNGIVELTKGSAAAITLAAPTATTDDYKVLTVQSTTAFAHVITSSVDGFNAKGSSGTATYGAAKGNTATFVAYQGHWYNSALVGVTIA